MALTKTSIALSNKELDGELETVSRAEIDGESKREIQLGPLLSHQGSVERDAKNLKTDTPEAHADSKSQSSTKSPGTTILHHSRLLSRHAHQLNNL